MATAQTSTRTASRANGKDHKAVAERAVKQDLRDAKEAATNFASAVKSSATHFGEHVSQRVNERVSQTKNQVKAAKYVAEGKIRERPLAAIGIAAGAGLLIGILARR